MLHPSATVRCLLVPLALLAVVVSGCKGGDDSALELPEGWEQSSNRWWLSGADTTGAFRSLEDLHAMGVSTGMLYASSREMAAQRSLQRDQLVDAVKRSLVRLYRNEPEVVDSLFERHVVPQLAGASLQGDPEDIVERNKKKAYDALRKHFREPVPRLRLGEDIQVIYPDSLRRSGVSGVVRMQVRVNEAGEPLAIELLESVHPVLDQIAMSATTRMRWQPAYVLVRNDWKALPSWSRFNIHFSAPESGGEGT